MQVLIPNMLSGLYNMGVFWLLSLTTVILNIGPWQWTWTSKLSLKQTPSFIPIKAFSLSHKNHLAWYNQVMVVINAEIYLRFNQWQRNDWKNAWTWVSYLLTIVANKFVDWYLFTLFFVLKLESEFFGQYVSCRESLYVFFYTELFYWCHILPDTVLW